MKLASISNQCCPKPKNSSSFGASISADAFVKMKNLAAAGSPAEINLLREIKKIPNIIINLSSFKVGNTDFLEIRNKAKVDAKLLSPLSSLEKLKNSIERFING